MHPHPLSLWSGRQQLAEKGQAPLPRVPFQDSKLTMLLQPALDGESCTSVVVCCAPENAHAEENRSQTQPAAKKTETQKSRLEVWVGLICKIGPQNAFFRARVYRLRVL